jgi:hypothetical protein
MVRSGHHIVDHGYRFFRNSVDDVIDADGLRDMVNEKQQQANADYRQHHCSQHGGHWCELNQLRDSRSRTAPSQRKHWASIDV